MLINSRSNLVQHFGHVTASDREVLLCQKPLTIWLTGLSASGKSTLAYELERTLIEAGHVCYVLDGDAMRQGINSDLGFSLTDRTENIRRVAELAKLMNEAGLIVISALISPMIADRAMARAIIGSTKFKEVFVSTPLTTCEARDPKGLYAKARAGKIPDFTGVTSVYEDPLTPDLSIDTSSDMLQDHLMKLVELVAAG